MNLFKTEAKSAVLDRPAPSRDVAQLPEKPAPRGAAARLTAHTLFQRKSHRDRRRAERFNCNIQTACVVISLVEPVLLAVKVRDISQTGIGLVLSTRLQPGAFIAVKLQGSKEKAPRVVRAQVMHATIQQDKRSWLAGCSLVGELGKDELALLI